MATRSRYSSSDGKSLPMSIRFTEENRAALDTASTLTGDSINSIVNEAVSSYLSSPETVSSLRVAYANFTSTASSYQETIDRLAGGSD